MNSLRQLRSMFGLSCARRGKLSDLLFFALEQFMLQPCS
jgi:hypothetical protein